MKLGRPEPSDTGAHTQIVSAVLDLLFGPPHDPNGDAYTHLVDEEPKSSMDTNVDRLYEGMEVETTAVEEDKDPCVNLQDPGSATLPRKGELDSLASHRRASPLNWKKHAC